MLGRALLVAVLVLGYALAAAEPQETEAYAVWDGACLKDITRVPETRLEAPMENGKPNMKKAKVLHVNVKFDTDCYRIEVRKIGR